MVPTGASPENTLLYARLIAESGELPTSGQTLIELFDQIAETIALQSTYIVRTFPEFTPHDTRWHILPLFRAAESLLGADLLRRLNIAEISALSFALLCHDWGMAISEDEKARILSNSTQSLDRERWLAFQDGLSAPATPPSEREWRDFIRQTHHLRSADRLLEALSVVGGSFAHAVARLVRGHGLDIAIISNEVHYGRREALLGQRVNLAALAAYVRILDLLAIGADRTPYALWRFVNPTDVTSAMEWEKHRALSPVMRDQGQLIISGFTREPDVYARLQDLREYITNQLRDNIDLLRQFGMPYDPNLDSRAVWDIRADGFVPLMARFEIDRTSLLGLLSRELYSGDDFAFLRELMQNSLDAVASRKALLEADGVPDFRGLIEVRLSGDDPVVVEFDDNGVGMDEHVITNYLGRVGSSWYGTGEFRRRGVAQNPISRFGVGLLSCFTAGDRINIVTKADPRLGNSPAYSVDIPAKDAHFIIRHAARQSPGTSVKIIVNDDSTLNAIHSKLRDAKSVLTYFSDLCLLADITIRVARDGVSQDIEGWSAANGIIKVAVPGATVLVELPSVHELDQGPTTSNPEQQVSMKVVHFATVYTKGLRSPAELLWVDENAFLRSSDARIKVRVNVTDPSIMTFSLSRNKASLPANFSSQFAELLGQELKSTIADRLSIPDLPSRAQEVGVILAASPLPLEAMRSWLRHSPADVPVLLLGDKGAAWKAIGSLPPTIAVLPDEVARLWEMVDLAPRDLWVEKRPLRPPFPLLDEVRRAVSSDGSLWRATPDTGSTYSGWEGPEVVIPTGALSPGISTPIEHHVTPLLDELLGANPPLRQAPWLTAALWAGVASLYEAGYRLVPEIVFLDGGPLGRPLVARILDRNWAHGELPSIGFLNRIGVGIGGRVVRFPAFASEYAAYGLDYWNMNHPKMAAFLRAAHSLQGKPQAEVFVEEAITQAAKLLETPKNQIRSSLVTGLARQSPAYSDWAIWVSNHVLERGAAEGIELGVEPFTTNDFIPGTLLQRDKDSRANSLLDLIRAKSGALLTS